LNAAQQGGSISFSLGPGTCYTSKKQQKTIGPHKWVLRLLVPPLRGVCGIYGAWGGTGQPFVSGRDPSPQKTSVSVGSGLARLFSVRFSAGHPWRGGFGFLGFFFGDFLTPSVNSRGAGPPQSTQGTGPRKGNRLPMFWGFVFVRWGTGIRICMGFLKNKVAEEYVCVAGVGEHRWYLSYNE